MSKKSFKINSIFEGIFFEDKAPNNNWKLEPKNQPSRTRAPVMKEQQTDDISKEKDSDVSNSKKKLKIVPTDKQTHLELGFLPDKEKLKVVVDNSPESGTGAGGSPSDMREISTSPKTLPVPVRKPQDRRRPHNVQWLDKLSIKSFKIVASSQKFTRDLDGEEAFAEFIEDTDRESIESHFNLTDIDGDWYYFEDLFVPEHARGQGVASALMQDAVSWADSNGINIYATVMPLGAEGLSESDIIEFNRRYNFVDAGRQGKYTEMYRLSNQTRKSFTINAYDASGIWAIYDGRVYVTTEPTSHEGWFYNIGLPDFGEAFDRITRGYFTIDDEVLRVVKYTGLGKEDEFADYTNRLIDRIKHEDLYTELQVVEEGPRTYSKNAAESVLLIPYSDSFGDFHRTKLKVPGEGHRPFMRDKKPGEGLSKIPYKDNPEKMFFETDPRVLKRYSPKKKFKIKSEDMLDKAYNSLYSMPFSELSSNYKEEILTDAANVWKGKDLSNDEIATKWSTLSLELDRVEKEQFIAILKSYKKQLRDAKAEDISSGYGHNPQPYYGDTNVYPYKGTGPAMGISTQLDLILTSDPQSIGKAYAKKSFNILEYPKKTFPILALEQTTISNEAYDALLEKGYAFRNYKLSQEQLIDAIDEGKDLSLLLRHQDLTHSQRDRVINIAIERKTSLIFLYEHEMSRMTSHQQKELVNAMYEKAAAEGTNLVYTLKHFTLSPTQKDELIMKGLNDGIGLHYLFKEKLLSPKQREYAVTKALETGYGLLELLKYEDLTPDQESRIIEKSIDKGVALIFILKRRGLSDDQKARIFNKALKEGKGYYYLLRRFKLEPEQIKVAIRKSRDSIDSIRYLLRYQDVTIEQRSWLEKRMEKLKGKKQEEKAKEKERTSTTDFDGSSLLPSSDRFQLAQDFFEEASDEEVVTMYELVGDADLDKVEEFLDLFGDKELDSEERLEEMSKKSFKIMADIAAVWDEVKQWVDDNKEDENFSTDVLDVIADEVELEELKPAEEKHMLNVIKQRVEKYISTDIDEKEEETKDDKPKEVDKKTDEDDKDTDGDEKVTEEEVIDEEDADETDEIVDDDAILLDEEVTDEEEIEKPSADSLLDVIRKSAEDRTLMWIRYRDRFGNTTERSVEPWETRDIYMFAHDPDFTNTSTEYKRRKRQMDTGTRQFIMASILATKLTEEPYKNPSRWEMRIDI